MTVYGAATGGPTASLSADRSGTSSLGLTHTNSQLQGATIRLKADESAAFVGATVAAADTLSLETEHLTVASVQDMTKSRSSSEGVSVSNSSGGANNSLSHSTSRETVLTSLTGNTVDIKVGQETTLTGATIAALDADGNDNGQLHFSTGTLEVGSLSNTTYGNSLSQGVTVGQTSSVDYSNDTSHSKTKVLGTIGAGVIEVADLDNSSTAMLQKKKVTKKKVTDLF